MQNMTSLLYVAASVTRKGMVVSAVCIVGALVRSWVKIKLERRPCSPFLIRLAVSIRVVVGTRLPPFLCFAVACLLIALVRSFVGARGRWKPRLIRFFACFIGSLDRVLPGVRKRVVCLIGALVGTRPGTLIVVSLVTCSTGAR